MNTLLELLAEKDILFVQSVIGEIFGIILLILFLKKSSRDERGKAIIGRASIYSMIYFAVITTIVCQYMAFLNNLITVYVVGNLIQFIFNSVILLQILLILLFKKLN